MLLWGFFSIVFNLQVTDLVLLQHSSEAIKFVEQMGSVCMFSPRPFLMRSTAVLSAAFFSVACCGSDSGPNAMTEAGAQTPPVAGAVILKTPVLSFNDTGLNVTDGITSNGKWGVESQGIDWEFSLDQGITWARGSGGSFEVKGDGAKMIWVRARDSAGNTSEIVRVNCVLDTTPPAAVAISG
jgi:hypothetical protein